MTEPPSTSEVLRPLIQAMDKASVPADPKSRAQWLAKDVPVDTGWNSRKDELLSIWRDAGLWLHPQGTLEDVLGTTAKGREVAQRAAETSGPIDAVAEWAAFSLDQTTGIAELLSAAVERVAHAIMEAIRINPDTEFHQPVGGYASSDARLVSVQPLGGGSHRLTVLTPPEFAGFWLDFSRDSSSNQLILRPPPPT